MIRYTVIIAVWCGMVSAWRNGTIEKKMRSINKTRTTTPIKKKTRCSSHKVRALTDIYYDLFDPSSPFGPCVHVNLQPKTRLHLMIHFN